MHFSQEDIARLERFYRANLINCCSGFKSANLLGTIDEQGQTNLALFSSVVHLGANPPLLGFVLRPTTIRRHTYENIKANGEFSINHITTPQIAKAHQTSAKYEAEVSEFEAVGLPIELKPHSKVPFVKNAPVQLHMRYCEEFKIEANDTIFIIAEIQNLYVDDDLLSKDGFIDLSLADVTAITGLDGYNQVDLLQRFAYARPNQELKTL